MNLRKSLLACLLCACFAPCARAQGDPSAEQIEFFEKKIRPVLAEHCYRCHSSDAKKLKGKLLLDSQAGLMKGGEGGVIVVRGEPDKSRLIEALRYTNVDLQMPPRAKLPDAVIADFTAWVKMGAPWGKEVVTKNAGDKYKFDLAKRKQEHWSWKPIAPAKAPAVKNPAWPACDVDAFILAKLEDKDLSPAAAADPRTLMRRLYFDIIGLPPTPQEIDAFLQDNGGDQAVNPKAVEKLVDRLLDSPQFGERWGRHWLDLVRYAESRGHEFDYNLPNAYQYRDYVIRALNQDVPYNRFVTEHLAGDLMAKPRRHPTEKFNESILGTGFWFLGEQVHSPVDICQDRADRHDNMIDVMSKTFMGLTVACARCHDHKFDAISTRDYYSLAGFLQSSSYRLARFDSLDHNREVAEKLAKVRTRNTVLMTLAAEFRDETEQMAGYLLGAREVLLKTRTREDVAKERKLKIELLDRWVAYLPKAAKDLKDPFHPWAKVAVDAGAGDARGLGKLLAPLAQDWRKQLTDSKQSFAGADVVIDYGKSEPKDWLQDGWTFGLRPAKRGDVRFGKDSSRPILEIVERGAAQADLVWDGLKLAPGSENESGSLDRMMRAGRTIRTPAFQVKSGRVHFLVKGAGLAYANVEGHVMIAGPLHGQVVLPIKTSGYQWVSQDLSRYKGLRAHIEFTPAPGSDFAVAMVVQGDVLPRADVPMESILQMIDAGDVTPSALAESYQKLLESVIGDMHCIFVLDRPDSMRLSNWLLHHAELFGDPKEFAKSLDKVTGPILAEQANLVATIKTASRLAPAMLDGSGVDEHVFIRGSYKTPGEVAPRRLLEALVGDKGRAGSVSDRSGRLHLAEQMTDPAVTPFVPRVMVNRVWHHLFGRGIVASVDNFGVLGEAPTHPELLDYLADQFVKDGWSTKRLIRRLVLSRTYQMSTRPAEKAKQVDAGNLLLSHMRIRRLEGEAIRDAILQVSGTLDRKMYGPSVPVHLTAFLEGRGRPASGPLDGNGRRSVYLSVRRNFLSPLLMAFDTPSPFSTVGRRTVSNVPAQALILLNHPFVHQQAGKWASRVLTQEKTTNGRITTIYLTAFGRPPSAAELAACSEFLEQQGRLGQATEAALWTDLAHVLFNAKEFIYLN